MPTLVANSAIHLGSRQHRAGSLKTAACAEAASDATTVGKEVSNFEGDLKMATNPAEGIQEDVQGLETKVEAAAGPVQSFLQKVLVQSCAVPAVAVEGWLLALLAGWLFDSAGAARCRVQMCL